MKIAAYILSFYLLLSAIVPCNVYDDCEKDTITTSTSQTDTEDDCADCPPFSICAACASFAISQEAIALTPIVFYSKPVYNDYFFFDKQGYSFAFFQPPRLA